MVSTIASTVVSRSAHKAIRREAHQLAVKREREAALQLWLSEMEALEEVSSFADLTPCDLRRLADLERESDCGGALGQKFWVEELSWGCF